MFPLIRGIAKSFNLVGSGKKNPPPNQMMVGANPNMAPAAYPGYQAGYQGGQPSYAAGYPMQSVPQAPIEYPPPYQAHGPGIPQQPFVGEQPPVQQQPAHHRALVRTFVRWTYSILIFHLLLLNLMVWIPYISTPYRHFVRENFWLYMASVGVYIIVFFIIVGIVFSRTGQRCSILMMLLYTLALGNLYASMTAYHSTYILIKSLAIMVFVCIVIVIYATFGTINFEGCCSFFLFFMATLVGAIVTAVIEYAIINTKRLDYELLNIGDSVISFLIALIFSLYLCWATRFMLKDEKKRSTEGIVPNIFEHGKHEDISTYFFLAMRLQCDWIFNFRYCCAAIGLTECAKK